MADANSVTDRYQRESAYEILGVGSDASAVEIRDRRNVLQREINDREKDSNQRAKELERVENAYNQVCTGDLRVRVDFFLLDAKLFLKQSEAIARTLTKPKTDVEGVIKPRKIRVTHAALLDELKDFQREPEKVVGFHPRTMEIAEPVPLPGPLAIQFDC